MSVREIPITSDASLRAITSPDGKLASDVMMIFPYKPLGEREYLALLYFRFVQMGQATQSGLYARNLRSLQKAVYFPIQSADDFAEVLDSGLEWLVDATPESPKTLVVPTVVALSPLESAARTYQRTYLNEFVGERRFEVDQITFAMSRVAQVAFDPKMPGGQWRLEGQKSITIYVEDNRGVAKEICGRTHPGQLPNAVPLL